MAEKNKKKNKIKNNEANWMVSNSAKLDCRTKQHTESGVSTSDGSRDMARTRSRRKKKKKKKEKRKKKKKMNSRNPIKLPLRGSLNIKYLGIKITDKRECFKEYKNDCILKAKRFANMTYSTTANACNKILIGKTFWKSIAMPSFLYAAEILEYTEEELKSFQRTDNQVYRAILELSIYTASSALRSEIGASSSKARDIKNKILFVKHILETGSIELERYFYTSFMSKKQNSLRKYKNIWKY